MTHQQDIQDIDRILGYVDRIMFTNDDTEAYAEARLQLLTLRRRLGVEAALREQDDTLPKAKPLPQVKPVVRRKGTGHTTKPKPTYDDQNMTVSTYRAGENTAMNATPCPNCEAKKGEPCTQRKASQFGKKGDLSRQPHIERMNAHTRKAAKK